MKVVEPKYCIDQVERDTKKLDHAMEELMKIILSYFM